MKWRKYKQREYTRPLEQQQAEKLQELGSLLQLVRLEKALSLEEIAQQTRIRLGQLEAIEIAKMDELPEPIYIKSFIKQYADALELDGAALSQTFPISSYSGRLLKSSWRMPVVTQLRPIHLYLLYVIVVICAVSGLSNFLNRLELQVNGSQSQEQLKVLPTPGYKEDSSRKATGDKERIRLIQRS